MGAYFCSVYHFDRQHRRTGTHILNAEKKMLDMKSTSNHVLASAVEPSGIAEIIELGKRAAVAEEQQEI